MLDDFVVRIEGLASGEVAAWCVQVPEELGHADPPQRYGYGPPAESARPPDLLAARPKPRKSLPPTSPAR